MRITKTRCESLSVKEQIGRCVSGDSSLMAAENPLKHHTKKYLDPRMEFLFTVLQSFARVVLMVANIKVSGWVNPQA